MKTYHAPPKGICKTPKLFILILFNQVDEEWGENQTKKANVDGCDEFLKARVSIILCHKPPINLYILFLLSPVAAMGSVRDTCHLVWFVRTIIVAVIFVVVK